MRFAGIATLFALFLLGCGDSGKTAAGLAPPNPAAGTGSPTLLGQPPKDLKEQPAAPRQLPPSEPYGTPTN
jgi:hypothetical protein